MTTEEFMQNGRIVYSKRYTLEAPPPTFAELVVSLDSDGNAWNGLATAEPDRALVTVKPGECLRFKGERRKVLAVEAYRATGQV